MLPTTTLLVQLLSLHLLNLVLPLVFAVRKFNFQVLLVPAPFAEGGIVLVIISTFLGWAFVGGLGS